MSDVMDVKMGTGDEFRSWGRWDSGRLGRVKKPRIRDWAVSERVQSPRRLILIPYTADRQARTDHGTDL